QSVRIACNHHHVGYSVLMLDLCNNATHDGRFRCHDLRITQYRLDEPRLQAFRVALEDVPADALKSAAKAWIKYGRKMPLPSELRYTAEAGEVTRAA
ncbi:MAG: hypothetical protein VB138_14245, partial [Burkholderia sp.]